VAIQGGLWAYVRLDRCKRLWLETLLWCAKGYSWIDSLASTPGTRLKIITLIPDISKLNNTATTESTGPLCTRFQYFCQFLSRWGQRQPQHHRQYPPAPWHIYVRCPWCSIFHCRPIDLTLHVEALTWLWKITLVVNLRGGWRCGRITQVNHSR
jgi:hypothetical protein